MSFPTALPDDPTLEEQALEGILGLAGNDSGEATNERNSNNSGEDAMHSNPLPEDDVVDITNMDMVPPSKDDPQDQLQEVDDNPPQAELKEEGTKTFVESPPTDLPKIPYSPEPALKLPPHTVQCSI